MIRRHIERTRLIFILCALGVAFVVVAWRIFDITYTRHSWYATQAESQASGSTALLRGNIYLADGDQEFLVAVNRKFPSAVVVPDKIDRTAADQTFNTLATILGLDRDQLAKTAAEGVTGSKTIAHHLTDDQVAAIKQLGASGVSIGYETDRSYPAGTMASNVIGFLGYDQTGRHGQYGIEASYENELSGQAQSSWPGEHFSPVQQLLGVFGLGTQSGEDQTQDAPKDVILTIDKNVQSYIQGALDGVLKKYHAAAGSIIVQDPTTGKILGMTVSPSFDPNHYADTPVADFVNTSVQTPFEPGSSFKPFTMAMGLDLGKITPDTTYNDDKDIIVDGYTIRNFNEGHFGVVTMTQVLEKSINAGTMYVESLLSHDQFLNYAINEGFGQKTGVDLPGEASGDIGNLYTGRPINFMTASFGQGITVTPLQLINGYSAIANGGHLMKPYVVAAVRDAHGVMTTTQPEVIGTPFSAKTAATLRQMLVSVVDKGFDKARIPRYDVAGKTGTAQIADPTNGGYLDKQYNHTFVGFAPGFDPKFVILIKMERPQGITFASDSLSSVFKDIALFMLNYLNVPPTR